MSGEDTPLDEALWRKSRRSVGNGACVEVTEAVSGIAVRDTTDRSGPRIIYSAAAWRNFGQSVRQGHFAVRE